MAHNIQGYITRNTIEFVKLGLPYKELPQNFVFFEDKPPKEFKTVQDYIKISTDYFGGNGEQYVKIFTNGVKVYENRSSSGEINHGLNLLGVVIPNRRNGDDEFDTLELGKYRTNSDFFI